MLELLHHTKISPQNTLIIFDEVQAATKVIESLKYFCEDASEYAVVAAGSLLGVSIHEGLSFPVGKVNTLSLYPMSFSEFLRAIGQDGLSDLIEEISVVQKEGTRSVKRTVTFYNLDAIISVGYRVNSAKATKFRIWATGILKEYIKKGFVLDDERLKQDETVFGKDYFRELLERENFAYSSRCESFFRI